MIMIIQITILEQIYEEI